MDPPFSQKLRFNFSTSAELPHPKRRRRARKSQDEHGQSRESDVMMNQRPSSPLFEPLDRTPFDQIDIPSTVAKYHEPRDLTSPQTKRHREHVQDGPHAAEEQSHNKLMGRNESISTPLHPTPERYRYRDHKGILREIWQPGDPEGERGSEFPGKPVFETRWRFFQCDIGPSGPPRYVILDDKAAWEVWSSQTYSLKNRGKFWPFDFTTTGRVRTDRRNRGRPAITTPQEGEKAETHGSRDERYFGWGLTGERENPRKYLFTGERGGYSAKEFGPTTSVSQKDDSDLPAERKVEISCLSNKRPRLAPYASPTLSSPISSCEKTTPLRQDYPSSNSHGLGFGHPGLTASATDTLGPRSPTHEFANSYPLWSARPTDIVGPRHADAPQNFDERIVYAGMSHVLGKGHSDWSARDSDHTMVEDASASSGFNDQSRVFPERKNGRLVTSAARDRQGKAASQKPGAMVTSSR